MVTELFMHEVVPLLNVAYHGAVLHSLWGDIFSLFSVLPTKDIPEDAAEKATLGRPEGIEPSPRGPQPLVLPLHHGRPAIAFAESKCALIIPTSGTTVKGLTPQPESC